MFQNRDTAWQELLRVAPDLLITDMRNDNVPGRTGDFGMSGFELLRLLRQKRAAYPILVTSGTFSISGFEGRAKQQAGLDLKIAFLTKPFTRELFCQALFGLFGPTA
jgi:CheY-like chemotaxis protein